LPIWSFNKKHESKDVHIETEQLKLRLSNSNRISITTGDKNLADYVGVPCEKLGYVADEVNEET